MAPHTAVMAPRTVALPRATAMPRAMAGMPRGTAMPRGMAGMPRAMAATTSAGPATTRAASAGRLPGWAYGLAWALAASARGADRQQAVGPARAPGRRRIISQR